MNTDEHEIVTRCPGYNHAAHGISRGAVETLVEVMLEDGLAKLCRFCLDDWLADHPGVCRLCGCDNDHACEGGCCWVMPNLCSACAHARRMMFVVRSGLGFVETINRNGWHRMVSARAQAKRLFWAEAVAARQLLQKNGCSAVVELADD
jgi:hypothetical protein